jgi:hypothetical protein
MRKPRFTFQVADRVLGFDGWIARQVLGGIDVRGALGYAVNLLVGIEVLDGFSGLRP